MRANAVSVFRLLDTSVYVVVQFYPWFKFSFLLFLGMVIYGNNMIMSLKQKKRKFEPRIKLNHNIYMIFLDNHDVEAGVNQFQFFIQTFLFLERGEPCSNTLATLIDFGKTV